MISLQYDPDKGPARPVNVRQDQTTLEWVVDYAQEPGGPIVMAAAFNRESEAYNHAYRNGWVAPEDGGQVRAIQYTRAALVHTVTYHGRKGIEGCFCGWAELGKSHPEHVADMYELTMRLGRPFMGRSE